MVYCSHCAIRVTHPKIDEGKICCSRCGRVLDEDNFAEEPTFVKNAAGQSLLSGNYVKTIQNDYSASRERTLNDAYDQIIAIMTALQIDGGDSIARPAKAFYEIAVERNFTRGRRKEQVAAACLYITCRENKKPFLLIDFSEHLRINVYVLGAVFLQLCKLLSLEEHPFVQKPVDPSLFIHRFSDRLFGKKPNVSRTALQIVASMKRDWMQTGRKPSGLCGAALYISALSHGHKCTKSEIIKVVHVCEATLMKRLIEFENTESGGLTIEEFNTKAEEFEREKRLITSLDSGSKASGTSELLCEHKGSGKSPFAHGLCQDCYTEFIKLSGGLDGGLEPPAFQRAEMQRLMAKEAAAQGSENGDKSTFLNQAVNGTSHLHSCIKKMSEYTDSQPGGLDSAGATLQHEIHYDSSNDRIHDTEVNSQESETLSDIDDIEVDGYLHNEEEKKLKKIVWEEMNKEYLEEQAAKEAAALAAKKAYEASFSNCSEDVQAAQKLAAAAAAAVAKSRKEKQQKRAAEFKNLGPAQTAAEATRQMLDKKRLSSKINYDVLGKLFDESEPAEITKKSRTEPESNHDEESYLDNSKEDPEIEGNQDIYDENLEEFDFF